MITQENRIITQLLSTIYRDKENGSVIKVNVDNAVNILSNNGFNLPSKIFEDKLDEALNKKLVGASIGPGTNYVIAQLIIALATKLHVSEDEIAKYIMSKDSEQDAKEIHEKIKNWRKSYYGAMPKKEKQALVDALGSKLRPEVIDQIKRA